MIGSPSTVDDGVDRRESSVTTESRQTAEVDVVVAAARVFAAVTAEAIAQAGLRVTLPQLRVLTLAANVPSLSNSDVARTLDIHISNASRMCDRLVQAGLLDRRDSPADRRQVELTLTVTGRDLVDAVTRRRRQAFDRILRRMTGAERSTLIEALDSFIRAGEAEYGPVVDRS
jgi:DNA-binding MarR family transcriptional regulator